MSCKNRHVPTRGARARRIVAMRWYAALPAESAGRRGMRDREVIRHGHGGHRRARRSGAWFLLMLLLMTVRPTALVAQAASVLRGTVVLPDGGPAPHAIVSIEEASAAGTTTDDHGAFVLTGLAAGRFTVIATLEGRNAGRRAVTTNGTDTVTIQIALGAPVRLAHVSVIGARPTYVADSAASGTKIPAPLMEVPVSVQVVPQAVLQDQQALRIDDALINVAGVLPVTAGQMNADEYTVRGFDLMGVSYDDGLRQDEYELSGLPRDMANVEQVEVVKGPASVLYGQAEPGGLVNVVTKQPLTTPFFALDQQIGSFATYRTTIDASGPVNSGKTVLYRLNLDYENSGSFRDFIYTHRFEAFPTLQVRPDTRTSMTFEGSYGTGTQVGDNGLPFSGTTLAPANVPLYRNYADPSTNLNYNYQGWLKMTATRAVTDDLSLRVTGRSEYIRAPSPEGEYYFSDVDSLGYLQRGSFVSTSFWHWADQGVVDLTGHFNAWGTKNILLAGFDVYYVHGGYSYNQTGFITPPDSINIYAPIYNQPLPPLNPADTGSEQQNEIDGGAYVQDLIALPANFHVLAGLRLDRAVAHESNLGPGSTVHDHPPVTPRLGVLWQASPAVSLYATYTSNYGYTALGEITKDTTFLPPESAQQYELGVKTLLFRRLSSTTSIYQLTKYNIATTDPTAPAFVVAIGQARSRGIEEDVAWMVATGWQVIGGYSYIDAHVTKDNSGLAGLRFTGVPYNSGSLWTTYEVPTGPVRGLRVGGGAVARSDETDFAHEHIPGFAIANAMLGYDAHLLQRRALLQLNLNNALNKTYFVALTPGAANPGVPRSVIASVRLLF